MIELRNLTKSYITKQGRKYVFRNLNTIFPSGKNIGIFGRNGAGKSTLLRMIGGVDFPDSGKIITNKTISWPVGLSGGSQGSLTGRDNVKFVCRINGIHGEDMKKVIGYVQDFAEIGKYFELPVKTYSTGMRARVSFGLSMAIDFDYYLIDEIMAVGDPFFRKKSRRVFAEKRKRSNIIIVSHDVKSLQEMCDIGVVLKDGKITIFEDITNAIKYYTAP
jgi:capsular polysaccharide transport system ATP-binding protein